MLKKTKIFLAYFLGIGFLLFIFLHLRFPEKRGLIFISNLVYEKTQVMLTAEDLEVKIPFRFKLINPVISHGKIKNLKLNSMEIKPVLSSLLSGSPGVTIKINGFDGTIDSKINTGLINHSKIKVFIDAKNLNLNKISGTVDLGYRFKGSLSAKFGCNYNKDKGDFTLSAMFNEFDASGKNIILPVSLLKLQSIESSGTISRNKFIFKDSKLSSGAGVVGLDGSISIRKPLIRSLFKINGKLVPNLGFLGKNRINPSITMLSTFLKGKSRLEFSLEGNLLNPRVRLK